MQAWHMNWCWLYVPHPLSAMLPASSSPPSTPMGTSLAELSERSGADRPGAGDPAALPAPAGRGVAGEPGALAPLLPWSRARETEKLGNLYSLMSRSTTWPVRGEWVGHLALHGNGR